METKFPQLRRRLLAIAFAGSLCIGGAICLGAMLSPWFMLVLPIGVFLFYFLPFSLLKEAEGNFIYRIPFFQIVTLSRDLWMFIPLLFLCFPESNRVFTWLAEGKLVSSTIFPYIVALWAFRSFWVLRDTIRKLSDRQIYDYYSRSPITSGSPANTLHPGQPASE